ncbi:MAG: Hsp70 family protein [Myxococcales bacterium]|nr:Hsp70 family protein [Myxococcales bacterium]
MTVVGIDLGTTNTAVAAARGGRAVILKDEAERALVPSVVSFHPSGEVLVGTAAKERRTVDAKNTIFSVKRLIGRSWDNEHVQRARERLPFAMKEGPGKSTLVEARGHAYTLAEISAFVLGRVKEIAEARLGEPVGECVITVPANFNDLQRAATKVAGRVAGLEVLRILNEPTAAALAYGFGKGGRERIAVYDFGGGTFDVTLLDLSGNVFEVLATAGDTFLGGDDIDRLLAERMAEELLRKQRLDAGQDAQLFERLRAAAEELKIELTTTSVARTTLREVGHRAFGKPIDFEFQLTRTELETIARPLVDRTLDVCREALGVAGLEARDFDQLLLVGGSTRLPLVQSTIAGFFGRPADTRIHPDEVVALGAALQAAALGGKEASKRRPVEIPAAPVPRASQQVPPPRKELPSWSGSGARRPPLASIPPQTDLPPLRPRQRTLLHLGAPAPAPAPPRTTEHSLLSRLEASPSAAPATTPGGGTSPPTSPPPVLRGAPPAPPPRSSAETSMPLEPEELEIDEPIDLRADAAAFFEDLSGTHEPAPRRAPAGPAAPRAPMPTPAAGRGAPLAARSTAPVSTAPVSTASVAAPPTARVPTAPASTAPAFTPPPPVPSARSSAPKLHSSVPPAIGARPGAPLPLAPQSAPPAPPVHGTHELPLLIDVTPLALGVEVVGGFCDTIIERNTPVPCERTREFTTARDGQTTVRVRVSQGQADRFVDNTLLGDLTLSGLRSAARGEVVLAVTFALDESGLLHVSAVDKETGASARAELRLVAIDEVR